MSGGRQGLVSAVLVLLALGLGGGTPLPEPSAPPASSPARTGGTLAEGPTPGTGRLTDPYVLRTYDVSELLAVGTRHPSTPLGVFERIDPSVARGFRALAPGTLSSQAEPPAEADAASAAAMERELVRLVTEAAGEDAWAPRGQGRLAIHDRLLCVWQQHRAHAAIQALLRRLEDRARTQLVIRVGVYVCSDEAADRIQRRLAVNDLKPVNPLVPGDAPPLRGTLLEPAQVVAAVRLLNLTPGSRVLFSGTVACLPVREAGLEEVRQVVFVSGLKRRDEAQSAGEAGPPAGADERPKAVEAEGGLASAGAVLRLQPVLNADLTRVQLSVGVRLGHLAGIAAGRQETPPLGPVHRPDLRTTALTMTLVVPCGQGVLVGGSPATAADAEGRPIPGTLMCVLWPAVAQADEKATADAADLAALTAALERPFGLSLNRATLAEAIETLARSGVRIEVLVRGEAARDRLLAERVTFLRRETTLVAALGSLVGNRLERVELLPPDGIRLHLSPELPRVAGQPGDPDEAVGTLTVRSADGRTVTRFPLRRRDLTPEVRAHVENLLSETLKGQPGPAPGDEKEPPAPGPDNDPGP